MTKLRVLNCAMGGNIANGDFLVPILQSLGLEYVTMSEWPDHDLRWMGATWLGLLSKADIVVCPQRVELQPAKSANRATQAMALGLPVVVSSLPAYREAIRHGETGFICDTPEEWRAAIEKLANDERLRRDVGAAAKASVKDVYSMAAVGARWKGLLERQSLENCDPPKVDIVIPTWNNLEYLKLCIDSIRKGTDHPHNIIVVTSGTDGTADWLRAQPDVIHHISDRRLHFAEANNAGLAMAKERYVMLLNDDTIVGKGWLSALMHEAMKPGIGAVGPLSNCDRGWLHQEALVVAGKELIPGMTREDVARIVPQLQDFRHEKVVRERRWIAFYATLLPRAAVDKIGLFDEGFKSGDEDLDYCKRLADAGYRIVQTFDSWIFHFGGKTRKNSERADHVLHDREDKANHAYFMKKWGVPPSDAMFRNPDLPPKAVPAVGALDIPPRGAEAAPSVFVIYTGKAYEPWTPKNIDEGGIGGSETATVYTARDFVRKGWHTKVFGDCPGKEGIYDGVEYLHHDRFDSWVKSEKADLFVSSRRVDVFSLPIPAARTACLAHDIWLSPDKNADLHPDRVDLFFVLSPWHKQFFMSHHQGVPESKIHITRDGVDLDRFREPLRRFKGRMIYSSSPDRGLETLLDCLPRIKKEVPHAELHVFYGFYNWLKFSEMRNDQATIARIKTLQARLNQTGVVFRDRLGQRALAQEMLQAELCAFPTWFCVTGDTPVDCPRNYEQFPEGIPISRIKPGQLVWTFNETTKLFELKRVKKVKQTQHNQKIFRLTLDNGKTIRATGGHPFLRRDGTWCKLEELHPGDSLMPLYHDFEPLVKVDPDARGGWKPEHRIVAETVWGEDELKGFHIHHKQERHVDSSEDNLSRLTPSEHFSLTHKGKPLGRVARANMSNSQRAWFDKATPEEKARRLKHLPNAQGKIYIGLSPEERKAKWKKIHPRGSWMTGRVLTPKELHHLRVIGQKGADARKRNVQEQEMLRLASLRNTLNNHKVIAVVPDGREDVWDMEVEDNHNFVVNGVVLHNCETFFIGGAELMAAGVPIVTSDLAAIQTTVGEAGVLIPGDSFSKEYRDRFVEECVLMMTAPSRWQTHHELGLERAKRFSWRGIADEWCLALGIDGSSKPKPASRNGRKIVYAFDVDETIEVSAGPVPLSALAELRKSGCIVGLCGNWAVFVERTPNWQEYVSFMGPHGTPKETFLESMRASLKADEYVMVGNIKGVSGASDDQGAAERSGWRFIKESDFGKGAR